MDILSTTAGDCQAGHSANHLSPEAVPARGPGSRQRSAEQAAASRGLLSPACCDEYFDIRLAGPARSGAAAILCSFRVGGSPSR
jgi:hypothetical protein